MAPGLDEEWPGRARRHPSLGSPAYIVRQPIADWLRREAERAARELGSYRLLDVGCGVKPYLPFFAPNATHVGVDVVDNPAAELRGAVEALPVEDASFDVVLCTQVLEHADDPAQAVRELRRVVAPGGVVLASTHGVQVYHPSPADHWRWTHTGLERLFGQNGEWESLTVEAGYGTASCLAMLLGIYVDLAARRVRLGRLGNAVVALLNRGGIALDRRHAVLRSPQPGTLSTNYLVTAVAPGLRAQGPGASSG